MRAAITILVLAAAISSLQAQQSGDDSSEKNRRLFTTETFGGTAGPARPAIVPTLEPFRPKTPRSGIGRTRSIPCLCSTEATMGRVTASTVS